MKLGLSDVDVRKTRRCLEGGRSTRAYCACPDNCGDRVRAVQVRGGGLVAAVEEVEEVEEKEE